MTETRDFTAATKAKISYANVSSVVKPDKVRHLDVAVASGSMDVDLHSEEEVMEVDESFDEESSHDDEYIPDNERKAPQTFTREELNDLVRDLGLPKDGAEYLAAALKKKNLLAKKTTAHFYRDREKEFRKFFRNETEN